MMKVVYVSNWKLDLLVGGRLKIEEHWLLIRQGQT